MTLPRILQRDGFERFALGLPGATLAHQWHDNSVAKLGGKIFALLDGGQGDDAGEIWLKVSDLAFQMMTELPGIRPAPYFARAGWVAISAASPLSETELQAYLREAHRLVAARLTRKLRAELGL
ncbi:MAG: hypothetical protein ABS76_27960 [Pelagibacterium sp. SCN 64-44]|nr:MAG: hypothetical protein ABS76_27960 [Pelagibacterium sp. SCN 64-44]